MALHTWYTWLCEWALKGVLNTISQMSPSTEVSLDRLGDAEEAVGWGSGRVIMLRR